MRVVALVGPSGTGKSHRASIVADEVGADVILDDGLLISGGKILAGSSAKREPNRVAAMRRALLEDPGHAAAIRRTLDELAPQTLLIIGISEDMIRRVATTLGLDPPERVIPIEAVASPRQMRKARQIRASQGKHVIPAPTLEVRKTFAGYPVDPLRVFVKARGSRGRGGVKESHLPPGEFIEKSVVRPTWSALGRFYIEEVVLTAIAARAAVEVPGVRRAHQVKTEAGDAEVAFELTLGMEYGCVLPAVAAAAQERVRAVVEHMTGLSCRQVRIKVGSIVPPRPPAPPGPPVPGPDGSNPAGGNK